MSPLLVKTSRPNLRERIPFVHVDALGAAFVGVHEAGVVDAHEMENGRVQIVDVEFVLDGAEAEVVSRTDGGAGFDAAAGHPHGETGRIVVAAVALLAHRRATELTTPDDECFIKQAA